MFLKEGINSFKVCFIGLLGISETFLPNINTIKTQNFIFIPHNYKKHIFIITIKTNIQPI